MNEIPAYLSVKVNFGNSDYDNVCDTFGGGIDRLPAWRELGNLLAHRPGWHFDVVNQGEALWCLGVLGECRLAIHVTGGLQYHCYDHGADSDTVAADTTAVESWLKGREEAAQQPSPLIIEIASADSWKLLKSHPFRLRVSWSDGYYAASVAALAEASFGRTVAEAVNGAAEMICQLFGAPVEFSPDLTLAAELDETAVRHIRTA
ncbi:hypothetical protein K388_06980 [Streptomyces sp. KhCrAH-43]|uniref:hypothetical protein n=1 Tax=unclassified Streptomyces TaxID=2593676 RepID=UPI0003797B1A|nr:MULTISPECIES: hypothetical protein [unclassified Streptomyces]MYS36331.1 hypothetical protein [Streptomyces sp. SID4920]MYX64194.1 hypothetical protein [Streptomyces sp. SID8373]RAJ48552.1 hypothetical protein K388_06980 [Streptomyces sp. KhCrAH-43]